MQAPLESRVASRQSYEKYKLLTHGRNIRPQGCYETLDRGVKYIECVINTELLPNFLTKQTVYRRNLVTEVEERGQRIFSTKEADLENDAQIGPQNKPQDYIEVDSDKPGGPKIYPKKKSPSSKNNQAFNQANWPTKEECKKHVSRYNI